LEVFSSHESLLESSEDESESSELDGGLEGPVGKS
jgi:hypothetical protein